MCRSHLYILHVDLARLVCDRAMGCRMVSAAGIARQTTMICCLPE